MVIAAFLAFDFSVSALRKTAGVGAFVFVFEVAVIAGFRPFYDAVATSGVFDAAIGTAAIVVFTVAVITLFRRGPYESIAAALELTRRPAAIVGAMVSVVAAFAFVDDLVAAKRSRDTAIVAAGIRVDGVAVVAFFLAIQHPVAAKVLGCAPTLAIAGVVINVVAIIALLPVLEDAVSTAFKDANVAAVVGLFVAVFALFMSRMNHTIATHRRCASTLDTHHEGSTDRPLFSPFADLVRREGGLKRVARFFLRTGLGFGARRGGAGTRRR